MTPIKAVPAGVYQQVNACRDVSACFYADTASNMQHGYSPEQVGKDQGHSYRPQQVLQGGVKGPAEAAWSHTEQAQEQPVHCRLSHTAPVEQVWNDHQVSALCLQIRGLICA